MENKDNNRSLTYEKAKKRVKEISNYYAFVGVYIIAAFVLLYNNYFNDFFNFSRDYIILMLILQALFLLIYGLYLFIPAFHNWEERKIWKLMEKHKRN